MSHLHLSRVAPFLPSLPLKSNYISCSFEGPNPIQGSLFYLTLLLTILDFEIWEWAIFPAKWDCLTFSFSSNELLHTCKNISSSPTDSTSGPPKTCTTHFFRKSVVLVEVFVKISQLSHPRHRAHTLSIKQSLKVIGWFQQSSFSKWINWQ